MPRRKSISLLCEIERDSKVFGGIQELKGARERAREEERKRRRERGARRHLFLAFEYPSTFTFREDCSRFSANVYAFFFFPTTEV